MPVLHLYTYLICGISFTQALHVLGVNDPHRAACYVEATDEFIGFDTKVYQKCKQYLCTPDYDGLKETGEMLAGCSDDNMLCWDWLMQNTVPLENMLYHNCKQYKCTAGNWVLVAGKKDPRCTEKNRGCTPPGINELIPFGSKGYYKCDQYECTENGFSPTGNYNPGCNMSKTDIYSDLEAGDIACYDYANNKPTEVGQLIYINCNEYVCTTRDILPTGGKDSRCDFGY